MKKEKLKKVSLDYCQKDYENKHYWRFVGLIKEKNRSVIGNIYENPEMLK